MSLSSIIHDNKKIRDGLRSRVTKPPLKLGEIKAAPLSTNSGIVGTAFDYLMRFYLQRINFNSQATEWVAEVGARRISALASPNKTTKNPSEIQREKKFLNVNNYILDAKREQEIYLMGGQITDNLLKAALRLAYLDLFVRAGIADFEGMKSPDLKDVSDLRALITLVDESSFKASHTCVLNPKFGEASRLVGGADADLIVDDCLIDIKTTKYPKLDIRDFLQLIGYYILLGLNGVSDSGLQTKIHDIKYLAIYFARFGYLWKFSVAEAMSPIPPIETAHWFFKSVCSSRREQTEYAEKFTGHLAYDLLKKRKLPKPVKNARANKKICTK